MKNKLIGALAIVGVVGTLVACGGGENPSTNPVSEEESTRNLTIGVGTTVAAPAYDHYGRLLVEVNFATALYEGDKVAASLVDVYQIQLDSEKAALKNETVVTKRDLHDDYAMKGTSANIGNIEGGAEWFEQAAAFENYLVGKKVSEINLEDSSLLAGCTMYAGSYEAACDNAVDSTLYNSKAITL